MHSYFARLRPVEPDEFARCTRQQARSSYARSVLAPVVRTQLHGRLSRPTEEMAARKNGVEDSGNPCYGEASGVHGSDELKDYMSRGNY